MKTVSVLDNLAKLREVVENVPDAQFNLHYIHTTGICGTIACSLGWAAMTPHFQQQDLLMKGSDVFFRGLSYFSVPEYLDHLFGPEAFDRLFHRPYMGAWDADLRNELGVGSGKDLALARIDRQVKMVEEE